MTPEEGRLDKLAAQKREAEKPIVKLKPKKEKKK